MRRPEIAEDLVQETFFAAVRTSGSFRGKSSERSWLCSILKNKICDYFRKLGRETSFTDLEFLNDELSHKFVPQGFWNHEQGPLEWKPEAEVVMHRAEFWETFRNCLSKLPERVADVLMLREMEEMETEQICRDLNISPNNLWVMLLRARMALRECLEMNWFKDPSTGGWMSEEHDPSPEGNPSVLARRIWLQTALVKFIGKRTPKCREVVRTLSQSMDSKLSLRMGIKLRLHYLICVWCQRYEKQLRELRKFASSVPDHLNDFSADTLSPTAKEWMKEALREDRRE